MRITRRELWELVLYLDNSASWMQSEENPGIWMHLDPEYAIRLMPRGAMTADVELIASLEGTSPDLLKQLMLRWTSFGTREAMTELLHAELKLEPQIAVAMGIALAMVEPKGPDLSFAVAPPAERARTFYIQHGGYLHLSLSKTDALQVVFSLPALGEMFFPGAFTGFVRAADGRTRDTATAVIEGALDISVPPSGTARAVDMATPVPETAP
jgi:hypothetical protein